MTKHPEHSADDRIARAAINARFEGIRSLMVAPAPSCFVQNPALQTVYALVEHDDTRKLFVFTAMRRADGHYMINGVAEAFSWDAGLDTPLSRSESGLPEEFSETSDPQVRDSLFSYLAADLKPIEGRVLS